MKPQSAPDTANPEPPPGRGALLRRIAIGLIILVFFFLLARVVGGQLPAWASWVQSLGAWGPLVFIALYILAIVLFVPGSILTLAGGALVWSPAWHRLRFRGCGAGLLPGLLDRALRRSAIRREATRTESSLRRRGSRHRPGRTENHLPSSTLTRLPLQPDELCPWPHARPLPGLHPGFFRHASGHRALCLFRQGHRRCRRLGGGRAPPAGHQPIRTSGRRLDRHTRGRHHGDSDRPTGSS